MIVRAKGYHSLVFDKLLKFLAAHKNESFEAHRLADYTGVWTHSTKRHLKYLLEKKYVKTDPKKKRRFYQYTRIYLKEPRNRQRDVTVQLDDD